jgi:hypothetical protein
MKSNPDFSRPDGPDAERNSTPNPQLTVVTRISVVASGTGLAAQRSPAEEPTLTERVLLFLEQHAA